MIYAAFILGLVGSLHCVFMCGPLMMTVLRNQTIANSKNLLYHAGRLSSYLVLGFFFFLFGKAVQIIQVQKYLSVFLGFGILFSFLFTFNRTIINWIYRLIGLKIKTKLTQYLQSKTLRSNYVFGVLNGFLPCGMVYAASLGNSLLPTIYDSIVYMAFFWLGTFPLLFFLVYLKKWISKIPIQFQKIALVMFALFLILRGLEKFNLLEQKHNKTHFSMCNKN